ncbi:MAG TPA: isocitrate/isopropylmalate family dehydrogenase [Streptosporangiaceae bacterium]|nr:isocitrate/isopropylmalate family dehydrogenase [Streptosporangiaceae bacterium]
MASRIVVIEGDGIGREVIPAAVGVVRELGLGLEFDAVDVGAERFLQTGEALPDDLFRQLEAADAILLGAIGDPRITDPAYTAQTLARIRGGLDLYANVRPARLLDERLSPLRDTARRAADVIVVRENTEGLYTSMGGRLRPGTRDEVAIQEHVSTYRGVARVINYAFSIARRSVVMTDKWNAMPHAGALWQRCWREACAAHPGMNTRHMAIDACALHLIQHPADFDVIVTENCFGDILSDIAGGLAGGVGLSPSANINAETGRAMFEPVHGSAPDIAGTGQANPAAAILTSALMLRHLGFPSEALAVESAVAGAVRAGECTADAGGCLSTGQAAAAVARRLR